MSRFYYVIMALCVLLFFAWGCTSTQGGKNAWRNTSAFYNKYINTPASLEFDTSDPLKAYQRTLVTAVSAVDFELEELLRAMDDSDRSPDAEWSGELLERFSWLGGVFIADGRGRISGHVSASANPLPDFAPLLSEDTRQRPSDLRAMALKGASGAQIYLGKPVYMQNELRAIIVCYFDVRALLSNYGEPEKFVMLAGDTLLWPGVYAFDELPLGNVDWSSLTLKQTDGTLANENGEFYWLATFFANLRLVYATPVKGNFSIGEVSL